MITYSGTYTYLSSTLPDESGPPGYSLSVNDFIIDTAWGCCQQRCSVTLSGRPALISTQHNHTTSPAIPTATAAAKPFFKSAAGVGAAPTM
jgi:hypothetical protein